MQFFHALAGVASLLIIVGLGYALGAAGWFPVQCRQLLPKLVTNVSLPPFLACTIISSFHLENLHEMLYGPLLPFLALSLLFAGAYLVGKIIGVEKRHFGLFCACVSNPNTIFIGIPVNQALFGADALPYVLFYYFASTIFFWTVGNFLIRRDRAAIDAQAKHGLFSGFRWRNLISAPLCGLFCGVAVVATGLELPAFIFNTAALVGGMTTPLALIFIGVTLQNIGLANIHPGRDGIVAILGRMVASPLLVWSLLPLFDPPELMGKVFVIQSSLPALTLLAILSAYYNTDPDFGSEMVALSTILCGITIPIYMVLI